MSGAVTAARLRELPLFASLTREDAAEVATLATLERHPADVVLFREGDPSAHLYVVARGRVTLSMRVDRGQETAFLSLGAGELLGFSALLGRRRVATARVVTEAEIVRLEGSRLLELSEREPRIGYLVMRAGFEELSDRLSATRLQLMDVFGPRPGGAREAS